MSTADRGRRVTSRIVAAMDRFPMGDGQPVVMREDDDLAAGRDLLENEREAVDFGRIHRLNRVIDDQEPERAAAAIVPRAGRYSVPAR